MNTNKMKKQLNEHEPLKRGSLPALPVGKQKDVTLGQLFRYATSTDHLIIALCCTCSLIEGAQMPLLSILFGNMSDLFQLPQEQMLEEAQYKLIQFIALGVILFLTSWISFSGFNYTSERQVIQYKAHYLQAIISQSMCWFDSQNLNELSTKITQDIHHIQESIGEKLLDLMKVIGTSLCGLLTGFILGWQLSLVIMSTVPLIVIAVFGVTNASYRRGQLQSQQSINSAGLFEQALNQLKTVKFLNSEAYESSKYFSSATTYTIDLIRLAVIYSFCYGCIYFVQLGMYSLTAYYGSKLILDETKIAPGFYYTSAKISTIFVCILFGTYKLGEIGSSYIQVKNGTIAAKKVFAIIDSPAQKKDAQNLTMTLSQFNGHIKFERVSFSYPTKPEALILNELSLSFEAGKRTAIVGASGSGKSTIFQLIQRFYEPCGGAISLGEDEVDLNRVKPESLFHNIAIVNQEPVLFTGTIRENLVFSSTKITEDELSEALQKANAFEFVQALPLGLNTQVGSGGCQLSGGQKQRLVLARALLKKPKVLLLDEATSALDRANEAQIQKALNQLSAELTIIIIAHRLATIQEADTIYFLKDGRVFERGTHEELMRKRSNYFELFQSQSSESIQVKEPIQVQEPSHKLIQSPDIPKMELPTQFVSKMTIQTEINSHPTSQKVISEAVNLNYYRIFEIIRLNQKYMWTLLIGTLAAVINGCVFPYFSIWQARIISAQIENDPKLFDKFPDLKHEKAELLGEISREVSIGMLVIGVVYAITTTLELFFLGLFGELLNNTVSYKTFCKLTRMPMCYYDKIGSALGSQVAILNLDFNYIREFFAIILGHKIQSIAAMIAGFSIAFSRSWMVTLMAIALSPITFLSKYIEKQYFIKQPAQTAVNIHKSSNEIAMELILNIKTVLSLNKEQYFLSLFRSDLERSSKQMRKMGVYSGLSVALSTSQIDIFTGVLFFFGTYLITEGKLTVEDLFGSVIAICFTIIGGMKEIKFQYDIPKCLMSIQKVCDIQKMRDELQNHEEYLRVTKQQSVTRKIEGKIHLRNVSFKYPSRDTQVLRNLNLTIQVGEKVALVGPSGCGKSTVIQLLMRIYEPTSGQIFIDDIDIRLFDINALRSQMAVVTQEPVLFSGSILENIIYNYQQAGHDKVLEVAKVTQAYQFITEQQNEGDYSNSAQGFDRQVGTKGSKLSGGEKQRVAIARALLRNCRILLLDEATSALDAQTEELVMNGLNSHTRGNTRITIAHRMCTLKDSDCIYVFDQGAVVDKGSYEDLAKMSGCLSGMEQGAVNS